MSASKAPTVSPISSGCSSPTESLVLVPGLNNEPVGLLTILDAATNTPDGTPAEDQLLRASIAGVTDADNPGGTITGPISYVWQVETRPGDGIFEDIIVVGGDGDVTATGPTFRPTQDLVGLVDPRQGDLSGRQRRARDGVLRPDRGGRKRQ